MFNSVFGIKYINGERLDFYGFDWNTAQILYVSGNKSRKAKRHYVCHFGGNPYPGTLIEYYNVILPTGKRARYSIYA